MTKQETAKIKALLAKMTLAEKVSLLSGHDSWNTVAIERLGIPSLVMTDGPHAVCAWSKWKQTGRPALVTFFPTGVALAATWNPPLLRRVGVALAEEALALDYDILLGPCVNMVRTPLAGRNFEGYGEDPWLSGRMAAAYIAGVQSRGVGTSLKHYACNNQEVFRFQGSSELDERTLREIYLPHFEAAVKESRPWTVMCAYNRVNGVHASENRHLLTRILREEWGYEGIVVSDWGANHTVTDSVKGGLDLEMPGPAKYYGRLLEDAVRNWQIEEEDVDRAAGRMLALVLRSGRMGRRRPRGSLNTPAHRRLAREAAEESITLLKNDGGLLPLGRLASLAVIGPNAAALQPGGGGSSCAHPLSVSQPVDALRELLGRRVAVRHEPGCGNSNEVPKLRAEWCTDRRGFKAEFFSNTSLAGRPAAARFTDLVELRTSGQPPAEGVRADAFSVRWSGRIRVPATALYRLQLDVRGESRVFLDGKQLAAGGDAPRDLDLKGGRAYALRAELVKDISCPQASLCVRLGRAPGDGDEARIAAAARAAAECDAAVVFVGMPKGFETEGRDRPDMNLPGRQDELVRAVLAANPRCAVVVNAGAPVAMPWADAVPALVMAYYPGMEGGTALARVLCGKVNPSGKLSFSLPRRYEDNPTFGNYPGLRQVRYGEGVFVGYRYYDGKGIEPLFPFGHGLSYTTFAYSRLRLPRRVRRGAPIKVSVDVRNTGPVAGSEVVQVYVSDPEATVARPLRELKRFAKVGLKPGQRRTVAFELDERALAFYDVVRGAWTAEPGEYRVGIGSSSRDIRVEKPFVLAD